MIQRYLYKRSRRKFAKSQRDPSPSRSRPKAASKRPRIKGRFIRTVPDIIPVEDRRPGLEETETTSDEDVKTTPKPHRSSKRVASTKLANCVLQQGW